MKWSLLYRAVLCARLSIVFRDIRFLISLVGLNTRSLSRIVQVHLSMPLCDICTTSLLNPISVLLNRAVPSAILALLLATPPHHFTILIMQHPRNIEASLLTAWSLFQARRSRSSLSLCFSTYNRSMKRDGSVEVVCDVVDEEESPGSNRDDA